MGEDSDGEIHLERVVDIHGADFAGDGHCDTDDQVAVAGENILGSDKSVAAVADSHSLLVVGVHGIDVAADDDDSVAIVSSENSHRLVRLETDFYPGTDVLV